MAGAALSVLPVLAAVLLGSVALTALVRHVANRFALHDHPGSRSSHTVPTPRLGGAAFASAAVLGWLAVPSDVPSPLLEGLIAGGALAALTGLVDDLLGLSPLVKLTGQTIAGVAFLWPAVSHAAPGGWLWLGIALIVLLSFMNFFNFMDGTDGLVGGVAIVAAVGFAAIAWKADASQAVLPALIIAAAAAGFLVFNHPPASIFMGDSGSHFLGLCLGAMALWLVVSGLSPGVAIAPLTPIAFDAIFTLVRRASRGEAVWRAHRGHLYQRLAMRYGHVPVAWTYYAWAIVAAGIAWVASDATPVFEMLLPGLALLPGVALIVVAGRIESGAGANALRG